MGQPQGEPRSKERGEACAAPGPAGGGSGAEAWGAHYPALARPEAYSREGPSWGSSSAISSPDTKACVNLA